MLKLLSAFLFPHVGLAPVIPITNAVQNSTALEVDGALLNGPQAVFAALAANAAPLSGWTNYQTNATTAVTISNIAGMTLTLTNTGAVTVTFDNAPNIVNNIPGPFVGMKFPMTIVSTTTGTVATPTVTNTGVTLAGTTSVAATTARFYTGQITQLTTQTVQPLTAGTSFTSITQIGSTNLYTLANSGNAITTTVGYLMPITVTAGTLPSGYYEVMSAGTTSVVIALPTNSTAWTATAATLTNPTTTVPITYAPLITVTGMFSATAGA